jgi:DNA-binding winged helix-turn-helix (wHTH) protein
MSDTAAPAHRLVRFGVFELDLRSGELRKSGARLNLQQQPLQLLSVLLEQPGELVTREELHKRLWPDDTFVDFEHGLNAAVKRLRDTLGDSADSPHFVETDSIPRRLNTSVIQRRQSLAVGRSRDRGRESNPQSIWTRLADPRRTQVAVGPITRLKLPP